MRKLAVILLGAVLGSTMIVATPGTASACDRHPCHTVCKVNGGYVNLENGTIGNGDPIYCYY